MTLASELGYTALADLIISRTPVEKRKLLLDYKKKVKRKNCYSRIRNAPSPVLTLGLMDCLVIIIQTRS